MDALSASTCALVLVGSAFCGTRADFTSTAHETVAYSDAPYREVYECINAELALGVTTFYPTARQIDIAFTGPGLPDGDIWYFLIEVSGGDGTRTIVRAYGDDPWAENAVQACI